MPCVQWSYLYLMQRSEHRLVILKETEGAEDRRGRTGQDGQQRAHAAAKRETGGREEEEGNERARVREGAERGPVWITSQLPTLLSSRSSGQNGHNPPSGNTETTAPIPSLPPPKKQSPPTNQMPTAIRDGSEVVPDWCSLLQSMQTLVGMETGLGLLHVHRFEWRAGAACIWASARARECMTTGLTGVSWHWKISPLG